MSEINVKSAEEHTWDDLLRIRPLAAHLAGVTDDANWLELTAELLTGGKSNLTFLLRSPAGEMILRRPPTGNLLPSAHNMAREARIQRALAGTGVPVAHIVTESPSDDLIGAPFYVMEKVVGHIIRDVLPDGYATKPTERAGLAHALIDTLASLHAVNADEAGLEGYGRPEGFVASPGRTLVRAMGRLADA